MISRQLRLRRDGQDVPFETSIKLSRTSRTTGSTTTSHHWNKNGSFQTLARSTLVPSWTPVRRSAAQWWIRNTSFRQTSQECPTATSSHHTRQRIMRSRIRQLRARRCHDFFPKMQLSSLFSLPLGCDFSSVPSLQTQVRRSATSKLNYSMDHVTSLECVRLHFSDIERFGYRIYNDKHRGARISIPGRKDPFSPPPLSPAKFSTPKSRLQHTLQLRHDTLN
jgi:hypothetical protein